MNHQPKGEMMDEGKKNERGDCSKSEITIREYFAAMAMQGFCSNRDVGIMGSKRIAEFAVDLSDIIITKLAKTEVGG